MKITHLFFFGGDALEDMYEENADTTDTYEKVIEKLDARLLPKTNTELHVMQFRKLAQFDDEPFDDFVQRVRDKSKICEFGSSDKKEIKSQIIQGCKSMDLKKRALERSDMTLDDLVTMGRTEESVRKHLKEMKKKNEAISDVSSDEEDKDAKINMLKRKLEQATIKPYSNSKRSNSIPSLEDMKANSLGWAFIFMRKIST